MPKTLKQYGQSKVRQIFFERFRADVDEKKVLKNPYHKIIKARDEIVTEIRNKEIEGINEKIKMLRVNIQNINCALGGRREKLDFFAAKVKELKIEQRDLRIKLNGTANERARLIIRRNELERSVFSTKY